MGIADDISAELPRPRPDEPESLRRDIIDEIADHLGCAHRRELQRTGDESHAHRNVLAQFGNPATIARRLWWDAMQEKIMSQRISTFASVIAAAACLGIFAVMWQTQAANRELLQATQAINAKLLEELQAVKTASAEAEGPAEWNKLQVRCVADTETGAPLEGVRVRLASGSENTVGIPPTSLTSDADGIVDFGQVLYGQYDISLTAPNGLRLRRDISVRPGQDMLATIVCPTGDGLADLRIRPDLGDVAIPDELVERIWYRFSAMRIDYSSDDWSRDTNPGEPEIVDWFVGPGRRLIVVDDLQPAEFEKALADGDPLRGVARAAWALPEDSLTETIRVEPSWYNVGVAAVCIADASDPTGRTLLEILNSGDDDDYGRFPGQVQPDSLKVVVGIANELAIPVPGESISLVERVLEAAPEMVVATLPLRDVARSPSTSGRIRRIAGDPPTLGNRVAIYNYRGFVDRRFFQTASGGPSFVRNDGQEVGPYLSGVEVLVFRDLSSRGRNEGRTSEHELRVLLTPEEREFFRSRSLQLVATVVPDDTERGSLNVDEERGEDSDSP